MEGIYLALLVLGALILAIALYSWMDIDGLLVELSLGGGGDARAWPTDDERRIFKHAQVQEEERRRLLYNQMQAHKSNMRREQRGGREEERKEEKEPMLIPAPPSPPFSPPLSTMLPSPPHTPPRRSSSAAPYSSMSQPHMRGDREQMPPLGLLTPPPNSLPVSARYALPPTSPTADLQNEFLALRIQHSRTLTPSRHIGVEQVQMVADYEREKQGHPDTGISTSSRSSLAHRNFDELSAHDYALIARAMRELEDKKMRYKLHMRRKRSIIKQQQQQQHGSPSNGMSTRRVHLPADLQRQRSGGSGAEKRRSNGEERRKMEPTVIKIAPSDHYTEQD